METPVFKNIQISPQNISPSGKVSVKDGSSVVSFLVAEVPALLKASSIRINGNIEHLRDGINVSNTTNSPNLNSNMRCGIYGMIDQIVITSNRSKQVIEHLKHYSRFMSSYKSYTESLEDELTNKSQTEHTCPNFFLNKTTNIDDKITTDADANKNFNSFSFRPITGFLGGERQINLDGQAGLGGIQIDIHLNSTAQFYNAIDGTTANTQAEYILRNLSLTGQINPLTPDDINTMMKTPNRTEIFNTYSSYYQTINSTNGILNFNLGASRVKSIWMNFCKSKSLNNFTDDGNATTLPLNSDGSTADIRSIQFLRNGSKYPMNYTIDTNFKNDSSVIKLDPQVVKNGFGAFVKDGERVHFNSILMTNSNSRRNYSGIPQINQQTESGLIYNVGVNYAYTKGGYADFSGSNLFGVQMDMNLTSNEPNSVFVFVHQENTLVYNTQGLSIMS